MLTQSTSTRCVALACALYLSVQNPSNAAATIYIYEANGNVEMRGSGTLTLTGLSFAANGPFIPGVDPSYQSARVGATGTTGRFGGNCARPMPTV